jgi:hypothetical protein
MRAHNHQYHAPAGQGKKPFPRNITVGPHRALKPLRSSPEVICQECGMKSRDANAMAKKPCRRRS